MTEILIIEDDKGLNAGIAIGLGNKNYHFTCRSTLAVLRVRIENLLKISQGSRKSIENHTDSGAPVFYQDGSLLLDPARQRFEKDGKELSLSRTEQRLLVTLLENRGNTVPRDRLIETVWDGPEYVDENALSVAVSRLRAKLEDVPAHPVHIRNVYGIGYV